MKIVGKKSVFHVGQMEISGDLVVTDHISLKKLRTPNLASFSCFLINTDGGGDCGTQDSHMALPASRATFY